MSNYEADDEHNGGDHNGGDHEKAEQRAPTCEGHGPSLPTSTSNDTHRSVGLDVASRTVLHRKAVRLRTRRSTLGQLLTLVQAIRSGTRMAPKTRQPAFRNLQVEVHAVRRPFP
jgi:hypothetical protein